MLRARRQSLWTPRPADRAAKSIYFLTRDGNQILPRLFKDGFTLRSIHQMEQRRGALQQSITRAPCRMRVYSQSHQVGPRSIKYADISTRRGGRDRDQNNSPAWSWRRSLARCIRATRARSSRNGFVNNGATQEGRTTRRGSISRYSRGVTTIYIQTFLCNCLARVKGR